jgi:hypothetical protein
MRDFLIDIVAAQTVAGAPKAANPTPCYPDWWGIVWDGCERASASQGRDRTSDRFSNWLLFGWPPDLTCPAEAATGSACLRILWLLK